VTGGFVAAWAGAAGGAAGLVFDLAAGACGATRPGGVAFTFAANLASALALASAFALASALALASVLVFASAFAVASRVVAGVGWAGREIRAES
jgi:hypothetical protein